MCVWLWHFGCASRSVSGWVGWHSLCLKSSRKVYRECTSAGLCVTSFNAPYPSAGKQPQTSLESTLLLSIQAFPCIPQLPLVFCLKKPVLTINTGFVCQATREEATVCLPRFCPVVCHHAEWALSKLRKEDATVKSKVLVPQWSFWKAMLVFNLWTHSWLQTKINI